MLEVMVASWNADERAFQVGDRLIPFTLYDIALILGLPVRGEPIDCNQSHFGGSLVEKLLNRHLKTTSPKRTKLVTLLTKPSIKVPDRLHRSKRKKGRGNLHIQGCTALLQESVVQAAMETLQETHGRSHTAMLGNDGAGPSNTTQTSSNQWQLELQAEITKREAVERHLKRVEDELNHVKGLVATPPIQTELPIQTPIVNLPSSPTKAVKRGKPAKKKVKAAMVDLASSPSKRDNEGRGSCSCGGFGEFTIKGAYYCEVYKGENTSPKECNDSAPSIGTGPTRLITMRWQSRPETYEITGQDVSSLLGDQAQDDSSRWISTAVVDTFKDVLMEKLTESGHPPPLIAQEFGNAFCWNSITIPCCPKLYKAKTGQFFTVLAAAQFFTVLAAAQFFTGI
uniref:Aminotransferase-like plant mobile domain-containing protein n=1 Tax=Fagus sylvatica TaxID=28930 RepID=A0A2N9ISB2_FAGSY